LFQVDDGVDEGNRVVKTFDNVASSAGLGAHASIGLGQTAHGAAETLMPGTNESVDPVANPTVVCETDATQLIDIKENGRNRAT